MLPLQDDLELLELWLDGELDDEQAETLRRRLSAEPQLAQALDRLRADRQMRSRFWQLAEPGEAESESLVASVRRAVRREEVWTSRLRVLRQVSAVAASILVVFMAGWFSRGQIRSTAQNNQIQFLPQPVSLPGTVVPPVAIAPPNLTPGRIDLVGMGGQPVRPGDSRPKAYQVWVVDPSGRVLSGNTLESMEDVLRYTDEMNRWQMRQRQMRSDDAIPVNDRP